MNIMILNDSKQTMGGGWSFIGNFIKAARKLGHFITSDIKLAKVCLIPSASMVTYDSILSVKKHNIPIILRVDNIPRNSRNRNSGTSRLRTYADMADKIVYQSEWSRKFISPFIDRHGEVIYNGIDEDIFNMEGEKEKFDGDPVYLYSRFSRDETKRWEEAWYRYVMIQRNKPNALLVIVGRYSDDLVNCKFDFFMNERYLFKGVIEEPSQMARIYRGCNYFLATYYNDCYSNTYLEAEACGCTLDNPDMSGGTPELINNVHRNIFDMFNDYLRVFEEVRK
jgi:glycosyltransferase involved in cell wall biosynthesis